MAWLLPEAHTSVMQSYFWKTNTHSATQGTPLREFLSPYETRNITGRIYKSPPLVPVLS
jgi:hypothetical protein